MTVDEVSVFVFPTLLHTQFPPLKSEKQKFGGYFNCGNVLFVFFLLLFTCNREGVNVLIRQNANTALRPPAAALWELFPHWDRAMSQAYNTWTALHVLHLLERSKLKLVRLVKIPT